MMTFNAENVPDNRWGILTYHYASNFGAFLQAYSFYLALSRRLPKAKVEFINYVPPKAIRMYWNTFMPWLKPRQIPNELFRWKKNITLLSQFVAFSFARRSYLPLGPTIPYANINEAQRRINKLYDIVVLGSDELWKINQLRPYPNLYWLNENISTLKLSFAPSANTTDFDKLTGKERSEIALSLDSFKLIGIRDNL